MPYMHKLSRRLALLKDIALAFPVLTLLACEIPQRTGPATQGRLARLAISPKAFLLRVNQTTDLTAQGLTATGQSAPIAVRFYVRGVSGVIISTNAPSPDKMVGRYQAGAAPGQDSVLALDTSGVADTSVIVVTPMPVTSVTVTPAPATVLVGQTAALAATLRDSASNILTGRVIAWTSGNPTVATVSATGVVTGVATGSTAITATSEGKSGTSTLTVSNVPVASVTVSPATAAAAVGGAATFAATLRDSANNILTGRVITWTSGTPTVATVSATGVATGVAAGSTAITASSEGKSGSATLTVTNVPVASVSVSPPSATIAVGGTQQLTATTKDSAGGNLSGRVVTWASSNTAVATVSSSGLTTGVAAGSATITATSEGKSGSAAITVLAAPPPPPAGVADPTLLPVASGQAPNFAAYSALNVASQPAGFSYNDPVTGVRIWKV
ncbi:MAG TPA: Ig-like domain-containing protein, partial [Gemmatimonadales bacterium]|nr:Ig-like domain-containing protein [Gemmatimonadales bacterium]